MIFRVRQSALVLPVIFAVFTIHLAVNTFCHIHAQSNTSSGDFAGSNIALLCLNGPSEGDIDPARDSHHDHAQCGCIIHAGGILAPPSAPPILLTEDFEQAFPPDHADTRHPNGEHPHFAHSRGPPHYSV